MVLEEQIKGWMDGAGGSDAVWDPTAHIRAPGSCSISSLLSQFPASAHHEGSRRWLPYVVPVIYVWDVIGVLGSWPWPGPALTAVAVGDMNQEMKALQLPLCRS